MKKKLESELISIAHRILKLKGKEDVLKMHTEVGMLYEKLSVLKFAHENFEQGIPTIGSDSSFFEMLDSAFNNKISDNIEREDKIYINLDEVEDDGIMEPVMEKIKDMVAQMPQETQEIDAIFDQAIPTQQHHKHDFESMTADFRDIPVFEPITATKQSVKEDAKKPLSLNDKLKHGGIHIGLNDKIAFIKHLFDGKSEDYERVLSQVNTADSLNDAKNLIQNIVKPDYNNWKGKEEFEERFMGIVESKFD
jgi:DNA-binding transcriptional regulator GbsR (MarR family)